MFIQTEILRRTYRNVYEIQSLDSSSKHSNGVSSLLSGEKFRRVFIIIFTIITSLLYQKKLEEQQDTLGQITKQIHTLQMN